MRLNKAALLTSTVILAASIATQASALGNRHQQNQWPAWYIGLHGGVNFVHETDVEVNAVSAGDASFATGTTFGGALGYHLSKSTRVELEYSHRENGFDSLDNGGGSTDLTGDLQADVIMANVLFDFPDSRSKWTPYFGGGLGVATVSFDSPTVTVDDSDNVFAYQLLLGTSFAPRSMPHTEWGIGYRFLGTAAPEFKNTAGQNVEHDYYSHGLEVNAKFRF